MTKTRKYRVAHPLFGTYGNRQSLTFLKELELCEARKQIGTQSKVAVDRKATDEKTKADVLAIAQKDVADKHKRAMETLFTCKNCELLNN